MDGIKHRLSNNSVPKVFAIQIFQCIQQLFESIFHDIPPLSEAAERLCSPAAAAGETWNPEFTSCRRSQVQLVVRHRESLTVSSRRTPPEPFHHILLGTHGA